ncbi:MAG: perosamine synthetase [Candidatus Scalindua rubra]|uniref:Perosamine synthetase n=1 Tax=Candidatus Scalindua rubra TaxID=1872076 RepID=A0A1E3X3I6_9BACT|nr:MAG: perosamine synthetase [Candidatus Scalindua rubra]
MRFTIGFEKEDSKKLHQYWNEIIDKQQWSEGYFTKTFEEKWSEYNNLKSVAFSNWGGAALAALEFFNIKGKTVLCPSNTFMATPLATIKSGNSVEFVDCNKEDLCLSYEDLKEKIALYNPVAVWVVHIGGHIAFEIERIADLCEKKGIILLEDCAHAHGATWNGEKPGSWGDAGIYSFYATKTISTGEGGMLVTRNEDLVEFSKQYRNYGKFDYKVEGLNYRMNEFTAAVGCVQTDRLGDIVTWKNNFAQKYLDPKYPKRVILPEGMVSGYYKYIVFDRIEKSTGKVYDEPCHRFIKKDYSLPNTDWVANNHWCVPLYYKGNR